MYSDSTIHSLEENPLFNTILSPKTALNKIMSCKNRIGCTINIVILNKSSKVLRTVN